MHTVILGPREHHNVSDLAGYRRRHAEAIARKVRLGHRVAVHQGEPAAARVDFGSWIVDCACGAGNAVDPADRVALCFACGAVHEGVAFPADVAAVEQLLLVRPAQQLRAWRPDEPLAALEAENVALRQAGRIRRSV